MNSKYISLYFLFLFFSLASTRLYSQTRLSGGQAYVWIYIGNNIPGDSLFHDLSDVYLINDNEGWITSSSHAEIYRTSDGGLTFDV